MVKWSNFLRQIDILVSHIQVTEKSTWAIFCIKILNLQYNIYMIKL